MLRSLLICITLSVSLIFISCSDSATGPGSSGEGGEEQEEVEPSASFSNPENESTQEGSIVYSIEGEAPDGFDEARIYVGGEVHKTVENISLPYEDTLKTYTMNNGAYQIKAEFDVSGQDTTVADSISVTFENYLLEMETDGYIGALKETPALESEYLIISDPQGNVLRMMDLTEKAADGRFQILPPSAFEEEAPSRFHISTGTYYTSAESPNSFSLETMVGFESWSSEIFKYGPDNSSDGSEQARTEVTFRFNNHKYPPQYAFADNPENRSILWFIRYNGEFSQRAVDIYSDAEELMMTTWPEDYSNPPQYYWERSVQDSIESSGTFTYNVTGNESFDGFQPMDVADVEMPSNLEVSNYSVEMSAAPESWDQGAFTFYSFSGVRDGNSSSSTLGMYVVMSDTSTHYYDVNISAQNSSGDVYHRQQTYGELPTEFAPVDGEFQLENRSMDDLQINSSGTFDNANITAEHSTEQHQQIWTVYLPDTTESFVYPKIADSLGNDVSEYDRSSFGLTHYDLSDSEKIEGYSEFMTQFFGMESERITGRDGYRRKSVSLSSSQDKIAPHKRGTQDRSEYRPPTTLSDQKAKVNRAMPAYVEHE